METSLIKRGLSLYTNETTMSKSRAKFNEALIEVSSKDNSFPMYKVLLSLADYYSIEYIKTILNKDNLARVTKEVICDYKIKPEMIKPAAPVVSDSLTDE